MPRYTVYLETSSEALEEGGYLAHVPSLIGCVARAETKEGIAEKIREAIVAYHALARRYGGKAPPEMEPIEIDIIETKAATFDSDHTPLSDQELDDLWHLQHRSRQEPLELPDTAAHLLEARSDDKSWSIRQILAHMAQADLWYASRLEETPYAEVLWRLAATRELVLSQLHSLPSDTRAKVTKHSDEDWTPRKVARRMLEHEAEHTAQIRKILGKFK